MRVWMDRMVAFAAWTQDLRIEVDDGHELEEPVTWSGQHEAWVTEGECAQTGERWVPDLLRVTRCYRVLARESESARYRTSCRRGSVERVGQVVTVSQEISTSWPGVPASEMARPTRPRARFVAP